MIQSNSMFFKLSNRVHYDLLVTSNSPPSLINAFWSFDGNTNEKNSNYSSFSNASYSSPGITGYGSALCFNASLYQSVTINLNISFHSFTFELWIYPFSVWKNVRISFFGNQCTGNSTILPNIWYHLTYEQ
jgi:hypothetical protein